MRGSRNCCRGGGGGGGRAAWKSRHTTAAWDKWKKSKADPEGGGGVGQGFPDPPGKSQVIWGSMGNKQLDTSLENVAPPPHLEKVGPPPEP